MVCVGVDRVVMVVILALAQGNPIRLAGPSAFVLAKLARLPESLDVVMVTVLGCAHLGFKAQNLLAVFAERAIHRRITTDHLLDSFAKGVDHQRVITQVARLQHLHFGVVGCHPIAVLANATHQHT